jgi:hypothetical protein
MLDHNTIPGNVRRIGHSAAPFGGEPVLDATALSVPETDPERIDHWFHGQQAVVFAGGHTHVQMIRRHKEAFLTNPGSIGLPFTVVADGSIAGPAWAEYGVVTVDGPRVAVELRRIPVDRRRVLAAAEERGMPHRSWWSGGAE